MTPTKKQLRKTIAAKRKALDSQWLEMASGQIVDRVLSLKAFHTAKTIGLYKAIGGEVDLESLFSKCWEMNKRTCIPVFNIETRMYEMAEITSATEFRTGHYNIQEPVNPTILPVSALDLITVPAVGFDPSGNRLGRGGGYYDRILDEYCGASVGVAFDFQISPTIPCEAHDKSVQGIVTETKFIKG